MALRGIPIIQNLALSVIATAISVIASMIAQVCVLLVMIVLVEGRTFTWFDPVNSSLGLLFLILFIGFGWTLSLFLRGKWRVLWVAAFGLASAATFTLIGGSELGEHTRPLDYVWHYFAISMPIAGALLGHRFQAGRSVVV
jgi:hypothetical protein